MVKRRILESIEFSSDQWSLMEIINPNRDHQLAFYMNTSFGLDLEREPDFHYFYNPAESEHFSLFTYADEEHQRLYLLLNTHNDNNLTFCKEFNSPYAKLFFIFGYRHHETAISIEQQAMKIPNTIYIQQFNFTLKSEIPNTPSEKRKKRLAKFLNEKLLPQLELNFLD